jgi:hypothetical protein
MGTGLLLSLISLVLCTAGMLEAQDGEAVAERRTEDGLVATADVTVVLDEAPLVATLEEAPVAPRRLPGVHRGDALLASQACAHESTFRGGHGGTFDCGAQIQVVQARRREDETFAHALRRTMPRFAARTTSRSWVHGLPPGPLRADPPGWPYQYAAMHDSEAWHSVFSRVNDFLGGVEPLPCAERPEMWFGRRVDHEALEARLASGRWRETDCNPGGNPQTQTLNAYLTRTVPTSSAVE